MRYYAGNTIRIESRNVDLYAVYGQKPPTAVLTYHSNYPDAGLKDVVYSIDGVADNTEIEIANYFAVPDGFRLVCFKDEDGNTYDVGDVIMIDHTKENDLYAQWQRISGTEGRTKSSPGTGDSGMGGYIRLIILSLLLISAICVRRNYAAMPMRKKH